MKPKKSIVLGALAISVLAYLAALVPYGSADHTNPIVEIWDSSFTTKKDYFPTCPVTVGIKTYSAVGPYDVLLVEPDGVTTHTLATGVSAGVWHSFTYTCSITGWWAAMAGSTTIPFGLGTFFVIPEVPLGVATALIACLSGLGYKRLRLHRKRQ